MSNFTPSLAKAAQSYQARFVGRATATELGYIRIVVCLIMVFYAITSGAIYAHNIPRSYRVEMGIMDFLYEHAGFEWLIDTPAAVIGYSAVTIIALLMGAAGLFTRASLLVSALLYIPLIGIERSYTWFNHAGLIPWYCMLVLCFSPCGDALSLDRRRRAVSPGTSPAPETGTYRYGWARYFIWLMIALPYVMAGLSKIRNGGPLWWDGVNLQYMLYTKAFTPDAVDRSFILKDLAWLPTWGFALIGLSTLFSEVGMGLVLVSRWARLLLPLLCAGMHVGILFTMQIAFWDLIVLQLLIVFDWRFALELIRRSKTAPNAELPADTSRLSLAAPVFLAVLLAIFTVNWIKRGEFYPITSMQMFSHRDRSGKVVYYQVYVKNPGRGLQLAYLDEMGFGSNRYLPALRRAFASEEGRRDCTELLHKCAAGWNAKVAPELRVQAFQLRKLEWNFVKARHDPNYGKVLDTIDVPLGGSPSGT